MIDFDEDEFRLKLITAQYELRESVQIGRPRGVLVLVNGIETAGKGDAVTNLRQWLDPRLLKVVYLDTQEPSQTEPIWQRFSGHLPRHGEVTVMFGNWYADLIYAMVNKTLTKKEIAKHRQHIETFEMDLMANDTHLVKCWFDVSNKTLKKRLKNQKSSDLYGIDWKDKAQIEKIRNFQQLIQATSTPSTQSGSETASKTPIKNPSDTHSPVWQVINGEDKDTAAKQFAQIVYKGLTAPVYQRAKAKRPFPKASIPNCLLNPDNQNIDREDYKTQLNALQAELAKLVHKHRKKNIVLLFEGMDAAGKGGAIKRLVSPLDPREYVIHNIAAPEPIELQHPYLWRFWHRLPHADAKNSTNSRLTIFDRSWYGRVLVERIEALTSQSAWQAAYEEINRFEAQLTDQGTVLIKFWLAIDIDEQLKRFKERENTPHKRFKITPDDWRNRDRWEEYVQAASDMLALTNHDNAPWHVIATNNKHQARLAVLSNCVNILKNIKK